MTRSRWFGAIVIALALAACSGGGGKNGGSDSNGAAGNGGGSGTQTPPPPAVIAPTITSHPQNQAVDDGQAASFTVEATGTTPLAYRWKRNGVDIPGASLGSYRIEAASLADNAAQFSVVVSNAAGSATSNPSALAVNAAAPAILTQPLAQTVLTGATATFSVLASGSQPLQYQWRRNGTPIPGANSSSYITRATVLADSGALFDVQVNNLGGVATSAAALLTVTSATLAPEIVTGPASVDARVGGAVAFAVVVTGTAPLHYQWKRNNIDIPNQSDAKLIVSPVSAANDQDRYTVVVSNTAGSTTSDAATLSVASQAGQIDVAAGLFGGPGNVDGIGGNAHFEWPLDVAVDSSGNLFVADSGNAMVRKVTPLGVVTTIAGTADERGYVDAIGTAARFSGVHAIAVDADGNVFVADGMAVRRIAVNGSVTTLAGIPDVAGYVDGAGTAARFDMASGELAVAPNGDVYLGDCNNHVIRRITPGGMVTTYAGTANQAGSADGAIASATFNCPTALGFDAQGNMYVSDSGNHTVRKITAGQVSTLAGTPSRFGHVLDGVGSAARFQSIGDIAVSSDGIVMLTDSRQIRRIDLAGAVTTVAGICCGSSYDGVGTNASFSQPNGIALDSAGNAYVADTSAHVIRKVAPDYRVTSLPLPLGRDGYKGFQDGPGTTAMFDRLVGITADASGAIYVNDAGNCAIRKIDLDNEVSTLVGEPEEGLGACSSAPTFPSLTGVSSASDGNLYVATYVYSTVERISPSGQVTVLAGRRDNRGFADGIGAAARFDHITGVAADDDGNVYVADSNNNTIRKIEIVTGAVSTLAGNPQQPAGSADGVASAARFDRPCGIEADRMGNVYVADCSNHTIRKVTPAGVVTTLAGTAGVAGYVDGAGSAALFSSPADVAIDDEGNLYVADQLNWLIRKITPAGIVSTVAGSKGLRGQAIGSLPGSLDVPIGIHARTLPSGHVQLFVTIENAVVRITTQ